MQTTEYKGKKFRELWFIENNETIVSWIDEGGHVVKNLDDLRRCTRGELVDKKSIYDCIECGQSYCSPHVRLVDNDEKKPLCHYNKRKSFFGKEKADGCYLRHWKKHSLRFKNINLDNLTTGELEEILERKKLRAKSEKTNRNKI